jgi:outer membrane protein, multidrug efflux system
VKISIRGEVRGSVSAAALPALCGFVLCLVGCRAVGPDYHGPPAVAVVHSPAANGPFVSGAGAAFSPEPASGAWWRLYESATLDGLVSEAFAANTDLRMAQANLERSQALLRAARAARQPMVAVNFDPGYQQLSPEAYLHSGPLAPGGLYDMGVSVSYELDLFGRLRRGVEAASAEDEAVRAAYDLTKVTVAAESARAYADACSAGEELVVTQHSLMLQMQSTETTRRLLQAGRAPSLDFTRSAGEVAQIKANIPTLEAQRTNALFRLAALTGHPPAEYPKAIESCTSAPRLLRPIPVGDGTALLRRRPDVREAERELAAATARIGVATADLYPRVTLGVTAGSTGAATDLLTTPTNRYGIGVEIHWQANRSLVRARIAEASADTKLILARFDGVVLTALRETESTLTIYSHDLQRDDDLATAQARAREAEQQAQRLYVGGKIDFLPFLDAQRSLTAVDGALAASHAQLAADQVAIFLALGGGWES